MAIKLLLRRSFPLLLVLILLFPAVSVPPARALPSPPVLEYPANGAPTNATTDPPIGIPTFHWAASPGAIQYELQVCPSAGCANPWYDGLTYNTYFAPRTGPIADGPWYWRVRAYDSTGWGEFSPSYSFTKSWLNNGSLAPTLLSPTDGQTVEFFDDTIFSWTPVTGTAYYFFQVATNSDFTNIIYSHSTIKPTHTPAVRFSRGLYYWRVITVDQGGNQASPSQPFDFYMEYLQQPTLLAPDDYSIQSFTPEFRWTAVRSAMDYRLQVSTVQDFSTVDMDIWTPNTRYTPAINLQNDKEYYWRVAARDTSNTVGPWVPALPQLRRFTMQWHLVPTLLTPTDNYIHEGNPVFRWTPSAGAKQYKLELCLDDTCSNVKWAALSNDPRWDHLDWGLIEPGRPYYWRVRAEDPRSNVTPWSAPRSLQYDFTPAPTLIYPPYYYDPDVEPSTQPLDVQTNPVVPVPIFMWDRLIHHTTTEKAADHYVIQLDSDFNFGSIDWTATTQNLSIAPSAEAPMTLTNGLYYWRLQAYDEADVPMGEWSEPWRMKFDTSQQNFTSTLALYFPRDLVDNVYDAPLFGWAALTGAAQYHFQISTSPTFDTLAYEAHPTYSFYTPQQRLAPELYYWRVRAQDSGGGYIGDWTAANRLVITSQLRRGDPTYIPLPSPISSDTSTRIAQDAAGDVTGPMDLTGLYFARDDSQYWYINVDAPYTNTTDMYFAFYVDIDRTANAGGSYDPMSGMNFDVTADPLFLPERVFYAHQNSMGQIDAVTLYRWRTDQVPPYWGPAEDLRSIAGDWHYRRGHYLELEIPLNVLTGDENWLGTTSIEAFTILNQAGSQPVDTVPSEATSPTNLLTNPAAASDKLNPVYPWDNPFNNPYVQHTSPMLVFSKPLFASYVRGYRIQVARDYAFTTILKEGEWQSNTAPQYWFVGTLWSIPDTFEENNTLYWRVRIMHSPTGGYGPWSQPARFTKMNYVPELMTEDYTFSQPTLRWDRVEGACYYNAVVDEDPNFGSPNIGATTVNISFTWDNILADRTDWNWRMSTNDGSGRLSRNTPFQTFAKSSEAPTLTMPFDGENLDDLPTFAISPLLYPDGQPVVDAPRYLLMVDTDPNFSWPYYYLTLDNNTWTFESGTRMDDGTYYWKVAVIDSRGNQGPYSPVWSFYKAYPRPVPLEYDFERAPRFTWAPVEGAGIYQVQICRDQNYTDCNESESTILTTYTSYGMYTPGTYYWRVRMCDVAGACGPYYQDSFASGNLVYLPVIFKNGNP